MRLAVLTTLLLFPVANGCSRVANCGESGSDCCSKDAQCQDYFGSEFPFCDDEGRCVECRTEADCLDEDCLIDEVYGGTCAP